MTKCFFIIIFAPDIDNCDPRNDIFSQEGEGSWTEFGYCGQHGTCIDGVDSYSCQCDRGWNGSECKIGMPRMLGMCKYCSWYRVVTCLEQVIPV